MKNTLRFFKKIIPMLAMAVMMMAPNWGWTQPWTYDFGTGTGSFTSSAASTTFLPTPTSGTARVRVGANPGSIVMANPGLTDLGADTELQITSNTGSTSTTKFSVYDYDSSKTGYIKFKIAFSGGTDGVYKFSLGDGSTFSDNNAMNTGQIFAGIEWTLETSNKISYKVLNASAYGITGISNPTTLFVQSTSTVYLVEVYANNTTSTTNYTRLGTPYSLANATWDLWVDGNRVSVGLAKGAIGADANFDSYAFNHQNSATAPGTIYIDDIEYSNALPTTITTPTTQASNVNFTNIGENGMTINWTNGDGAKRVVIMNTTNSFTNPADETDPPANSVYNGSGEQVVYNNSSNSVAVTGLSASKTYWYRVYEYNGSGSNTKYLTSTATDNPNSQATTAPLPTITVSTSSLTDFGNQQINTTSAEKTYNVSGSNLTGNIAITPPAGFLISTTSGSGYSSNTIVLTQSSGSVGSTPIYVVFNPTAIQAYSGNITHTSLDAIQVNVAVSGNVLEVEPTSPASNVSFTNVTTTSLTVDWTNGNGASRLVLMKAGSAVDSPPVDGTVYTPNATFGSGTQIGTGNYVVYSSTSNTVNISGLSASTTYHVAVYEYAGTGTASNFLTTNPATGSQAMLSENISISALGTAVTENFDLMNTDTKLPDGFLMCPSTVSPEWENGIPTVSYSSSVGSTPTSGGTYNWGTIAPERAVGAMTSGSFASPSSLMSKYRNNSGSAIATLIINYDLERYRINTAEASVTFFYSPNGSTWTEVAAGEIAASSLPTGSSAYDFNPSGTPSNSNCGVISKVGISISDLSLSSGSDIYLRWNLNTTGSNSQGIGIDNISVTAYGSKVSTEGGDWNSITWSPTGTPTATDDVTIDHVVTISEAGTADCHDLTIGTGSLSILSAVNSTGSLITSGIVSGNITVQRYIPGASEDWHLVSSPLNGQGITGNWIPNGTYPDGSGYDFYAWHEDGQIWVNRKNTIALPNGEAPRFDDAFVNGNLNFNTAKGYMTAYQELNPTKSFAGAPYTTNQTYALSRTGAGTNTGLNLVGNPFPATIAGNSGADATNNFLTANAVVLDDLYEAYYYWDTPSEDYVAINQSSGGHFIEVGQGFFVVANADDDVVNFNTNLRKHGSATFYKNRTERKALQLVVHSETGKINQTELYFDNNMTKGLDPGFDAAKLQGNTSLSLYSFLAEPLDKIFAIQALPVISEEIIVPIGITVDKSGVYQLSFDPTEAFEGSIIAFLFDKENNIQTQIDESTIYSFSITEPGVYDHRFEIHFGAVGIGEQDQAATLNAYVYDNRLYVNNSLDKAQLAIYDLQGRLVVQQAISEAGLQALPLNLPAGIYVLQLSNAQQTQSVKINVQ